MNPQDYLRGSMAAHPAIGPQDLFKHCYQAAFGAEHLLADRSAAKAAFDAEFAAVPPRAGKLCEELSDQVCRLHLDVWKQRGLPADWLFSLFVQSKPEPEDIGVWLDAAAVVMPQATNAIEAYRRNPHPVHHSDAYRAAECPAYRVVSRRLCRLLPILKRIGVGQVIAIDGRAAAGKSTLAADLAAVTGASIIHMDDFFLPLALRTPQRLATPGGNVHYERFAAEVLPYLRTPQPFAYQRFDCSQMALAGYQTVAPGLRIVEGSYSHHPFFGNYADLTVFCDIDPAEQMRRIVARNGEAMAERFEQEWIPMEEAYFKTYDIKKGLVI